MPRPGPRPYECIRRAWHSESHQSLRGSLTQEIFRIVTDFHSAETRSKKEWQEKLPIVVLRAEEILYSKARSEAEYSDVATLKTRLDDAVNTMIRRTDENRDKEDGPYMEPCVEAALSLGCTPKMNPRGQRGCPARLSGSGSSNAKRGSPISSSNSSSPSAAAAASASSSSCSPSSSSSITVAASSTPALNPAPPSSALNVAATNAPPHHQQLHHRQEHQHPNQHQNPNQNQNRGCLAFLNIDATWPSPAMVAPSAAAAPPAAATTELQQQMKSSVNPPFGSFPEFACRDKIGIGIGIKNPQQDFTFAFDHHHPVPPPLVLHQNHQQQQNHLLQQQQQQQQIPIAPFGFRIREDHGAPAAAPPSSCSSLCFSEESSDLSYAAKNSSSSSNGNRIATGFGNPYLRLQQFHQNQPHNSQESLKNSSSSSSGSGSRILASIFPDSEHDLELCLAPPKIINRKNNSSSSSNGGQDQMERMRSPSSTSSGSSSSSMLWQSGGADCFMNHHHPTAHPDCSKRKAFGFPALPVPQHVQVQAGTTTTTGLNGVKVFGPGGGGGPVGNSVPACFEVSKRPREFPF